MTRIGIDAVQVAAGGKGHARTQRHLAESLAAHGGHELVAFVRSEAAAALLSRPGIETQLIREPLFLLWQQAGMPRAFRRHRLDAMLTLTDRLPVAGGGRYVVWLFELPTHRIDQNRRSGTGAYQRASDVATAALWKRSLRQAAAVVAGSQATAREIEEALPELAGCVRVIYPGLGEGFGPGPGRLGRYLLHVASSDPRDNTEIVLEAHASLPQPVPLLVAGDIGGRRLEPGEGVELLGRVSDEELLGLYRGAAAYVDASLYEGFGYQPLEAMACGTPVVASSASSIPEVVDDAGLLCDPRSAEALAGALVRVLEEPGLAEELRRRGLEQAGRFTWERTAAEFAELLAEVVR